MHSVCTRKRWESSGMCERLNLALKQASDKKGQGCGFSKAVLFNTLENMSLVSYIP